MLARIALTATTLAIALGGCYDPDLSGPGGFGCKKSQECPDGFTCVAGVCLREGQTGDQGTGEAPPDDGGGGDAGGLSCKVNNDERDISGAVINVGERFSFVVRGPARGVSFSEFTLSPWANSLYVTVGAVTKSWATPKVVATKAGDHSAFDFTKLAPSVEAIVLARTDAQTTRLYVVNDKLVVSATVEVDPTSGTGEYPSIGPHAKSSSRWLAYQGGTDIKRCVFDSSTSTVPVACEAIDRPGSIAKIGRPTSQGFSGNTHYLAYYTSDGASAYRSAHDGTSWKHTWLFFAGSLQDVEISLDLARDGSYIVWTAHPPTKPVAVFGWDFVPSTLGKEVSAGSRPSLARTKTHEAVAYLDPSSNVMLRTRAIGSKTWSDAVAVYGGGYVSRVILQEPALTVGPKPNEATWELVYRRPAPLWAHLFHRTVTCTYR